MVATCKDVLLSTAGGLHYPKKDVCMPITELGCDTDAVVMPNSPDILSMGEMCMVNGVPWFVTDKKDELILSVENECPIAKSRYIVRSNGDIVNGMPAPMPAPRQINNRPPLTADHFLTHFQKHQNVLCSKNV